VYDGPPSAGRLIEATEVDGATPKAGGSAQFQWLATTPGVHTLHELLIGADHATDSERSVKIRVLASRSPSRGRRVPRPRVTG